MLRPSWPWPTWATLVFLGLAAALIVAIYLHERGSAGRSLRLCLAAIRFTAVGILLLMLAQWLLELQRTGLPTVVLVIDDSASMSHEDRYADEKVRAALLARVQRLGLDKLTRLNLSKTLLLENDGNLLGELQRRYKLKVYFASESVRGQDGDKRSLMEKIRALDATGEATRLGQDVRGVLNDLRGTPPVALVLITDGVTTEGETLGEVAAYARRKSVPVFSIGLGNEQPEPDLRLADLSVDEVVFVDDLVNFNFKVVGTGMQGRSVGVVLRENGQEVARDKIVVGADGQAQQGQLLYRPTREGDFEYVVELEKQPEQLHADNNSLSRIVSVRKAEIRVLMVQQYPNYEFRYLRQLLARDAAQTARDAKTGVARRGKIELKTVLLEADVDYDDPTTLAGHVFPVRKEDLLQFDVLIFGDVNPTYLSAAAMRNIVDFVTEKGRGVIFVAGPRFTPLAYRDTPLAPLFPIDLSTATLPDANQPLTKGFTPRPTPLGAETPNMLLGDSPAQSLATWSHLPPLFWLLQAKNKDAARVLADNPAAADASGVHWPVFTLQYVGSGMVLFHATDETWRWRRLRGDELFARYWLQTIRFLSRSKIGSRTAELTVDRPQGYRRGESVALRVRFNDDRLAPAADDGVTVMVQRESSAKTAVQLTRSAAAKGLFEGQLDRPAEGRIGLGSRSLRRLASRR